MSRMKIQNIEALRAVAALIVVAIHIEPLFSRLGIAVPKGGVDLFFVISGFIMVVIARDELPGKFLWRRVARVVPLYWVLTLFTFGAALILPAFFHNTTADAADLVRSLFFMPFVKDGATIPQPILFVGWTLNYEAFFYALFALGLAFGRRGVWLPVAAILALVLAGVAFRPSDPVMAFYTAPILLEFLFGMGVGFAYLYTKPIAVQVAIPVFVVSLVAMLYGDHFVQFDRAFVAGLPAAFFLTSTLALEGQKWTLPDFKLGGASYAIYLTHPFIAGVVMLLYARLPPNPAIAFGLILATGVAVCTAGLVVFYLFERPTTQWLLSVAGHGASAVKVKARVTPSVPRT